MKKIMKNNIKIISGVVLMLIILALLILIFLNIEYITKATEEEIDAETEELETSEPTTVSEETSTGEVGEYAYISSVQITKTVTGVAPFDTTTTTDSKNSDGTVTWTAGDDSSDSDNIVRSFDQITWTIDNTMKLKETATEANYTGGTINITATVPSDLANLVEWDIDSMAWAENATVSSDGTTFTAQYTMTDTSVTIPGQQSLVLVLQVYGASNGTEITPTFTVSLEGNDETEIIQTTGETIYVSATPSYNIQLKRNSGVDYKSYFDLETGQETDTLTNTSVYGRMQGYGITIQLYNTSEDKGLKGIEIPTGEITFDVTFSESDGSNDLTNAEGYTPILWDYIENTRYLYAGNLEKNIYWGTNSSYAYNSAPLNTGGDYESCYNGGNWTVEYIGGTTYHVSIKDFEFDLKNFEFPTQNASWANNAIYGENVGCFSAGYLQVIMQIPENVENITSIYMKAEISNINTTSISGVISSSDVNPSDNLINSMITITPSGSYEQRILLSNDLIDNIGKGIWFGNDGDGNLTLNETFIVDTRFDIDYANESDIYTANKFIKFDGDAFEPEDLIEEYYEYISYLCEYYGVDEDEMLNYYGTENIIDILNYLNNDAYSGGNSFYFYENYMTIGNAEFRMWYVTKKDGTNWNNANEMNNANIEDMLIFETMEDIPDGYVCVGEYFETTEGYLARAYGYNNEIAIKLKVKDTAIIGETYGMTERTQMWVEDLDRGVYSILYPENDYPTADYDSGNCKYIKTEYDENGQIITGTHYGGVLYGNTILIVGGELTVTKTAIDDDENEKINYDYSYNEYNVTYQIKPNLSASTIIKGATLKITETLPVGMTYVAGSSDYGEPEITENSDGTTTLIWYLYGISSDEELPTITYQAHLDELLSNGTQLETTTVIAEVPDEDEDGNLIYKIGNTEVTNRTYSYDIQIINLSSYTFYKTTETPVIEVDGTIHYRLTVLNNTDEDVTDFQLLDILPYNGDGRGTSYSGTYTVSQIAITQTNTSTSEEITDNTLNLYITGEESVREGVTAQDDDLGQTAIWTSSTEGTEINEELTAYAVIGTLKAREKLEIDIYMKTEDNEPYDVYKNSATAQTNTDTEAMETSIITVQDIKRILDGYVWFDINRDGLINDGEEYLEGIKVTLLDSEGNTAYDINGEEISSVYTDAEGYYKFENMIIGDYIVQIDWSSISNYEQTQVTTKEVGVNVEINSKFNSNGKTDVITSLNSVESPVMKENYVNAGITYIPGTITITKVAEEKYSKVLSGTEFALYKLECTEHVEGYHDDRLVEEDEDCWTLVSTGTTGDDGTLSFGDLTVIYEYRLVETKASEDRLIASGEWKIEFIYGDEVNNYGTDDTIINVDGTLMRITAVGNPPAMVQTSDGLLVPNKLIYEIPVSGGLGVSDYLKIGLTVTFVGLIVFGLYQMKRRSIKNKV